MLTVATACSHNHHKTMLQFLKSLYDNCHKNEIDFQCYMYDLGDLTEKYKKLLQLKFPNIIIRVFDYTKYPSYFNIQINAGEYAWKSAIIYEISQELSHLKTLPNNILLWCDAGNLIVDNIQIIIDIIQEIHIYSPISSGTVKKWTHHKVLEYFNIDDNSPLLDYPNRTGGILCFNLLHPYVNRFIETFYNYALIKDVISPEGSSRENHRQDQSLFTILYYWFVNEHKLDVLDQHVVISIHNDID